MSVIPDPLPQLDSIAAERAMRRLDRLTKPPGSLGRLERLAVELAAIQAEALPRLSPPAMLVFAADHGVAAEGVSAFPQAVTAQMVANSPRAVRPSTSSPASTGRGWRSSTSAWPRPCPMARPTTRCW